MRDPKRISEFCNKLAEIWQRYPDFRFSQMLLNFFRIIGQNTYFMEDEETIKRLETWMDGFINPRKKYRKKPIIIEAYQTEQEKDIKTLEGTMHASVGDYIITGVDGEQYPCKPDIFEKTYELVGE